MLEYFISTHGARKGLADTALRTADSGYLTRRLVDVSQDVIIREEDCGTDGCDRRAGAAARRAAEPVEPDRARDGGRDQDRPAASWRRATEINGARLRRSGGAAAEDRTRSPSRCARCCTAGPRSGSAATATAGRWRPARCAEIGDAVGTVAAQSIGEPGTQLTMRTFHTGGVAGADITHGLPRVVELFEARKPKAAATLSEIGRPDRGAGDRPRLRRASSTPRPRTASPSRPSTPSRGAPACGCRTASRSSQGTPLNEGPLAPPSCSTCAARPRPPATSWPRCRRSTRARAWRSTTSTSS